MSKRPMRREPTNRMGSDAREAAQPIGQPDRREAALLGALRASRSGGRLP